MKNKDKEYLILSFIGCLTLGLTPYLPEPHIVGKIRWIMGGAKGMQTMDYLDFIMHGIPWVLFLYFSFKMVRTKFFTTKES